MCNSLASLDEESHQGQAAADVASLVVSSHVQSGQRGTVEEQRTDLSAESATILRKKIVELQKEYDQEARNLRLIQAKNKELQVFERLRLAHAEDAGLGNALDGDLELKERVDLVAASWQKLYDIEQDVNKLKKEFGEDNVWDYAYNNSRGIV